MKLDFYKAKNSFKILVLQKILLPVLLALPVMLFGQAPKISYPATLNYTVGKAITPIIPTNTGGAVPAMAYGQVSTVAGNGTYDFHNDAVALNASFRYPSGVTLDTLGNIYVADTNNELIRKISTTGVVSTYAGIIGGGHANGTTSEARFNSPNGLSIDASGNMFIADYGNNTGRKISPSGQVYDFSTDVYDWSNVVRPASWPFGTVVDASDNIYFTDAANNFIIKIGSKGGGGIFSGSGDAGWANGINKLASFNTPKGITVDGNGIVYVTDAGNNLIRKIDQNGTVTTLAGSRVQGSTNGKDTTASFYYPIGIAVDATGNVYVADNGNNLIRKISPSGLVSTFAGSTYPGTTNGVGTLARFSGPVGLCLDKKGNLFVADAHNNLIRKISIYGYSISPDLPTGLTFDGTTGTISGTPLSDNNQTTYTITAYNSSGISTTTVSLAVALPHFDLGLSNLLLDYGTLSPSFTTADTNYTVKVLNSSISLTPIAGDPTFIIKVNGTKVLSGTSSANIPLKVGDNKITVLVTSQDGSSQKTYTITVTRLPNTDASLSDILLSAGTLNPFFSSNTYSYTVGVNNATDIMLVQPYTTYTDASVTVNGVLVPRYSTSNIIPLNVGSNIITIVGTAQDGITTLTYKIKVLRASNNADLSSIALSEGVLRPLFSSNITNYADTVNIATSNISISPFVADSNATLTVNGKNVDTRNPFATIPLKVGSNAITIIVTAEGGATKTYSINVYRVTSTNANLSNLTLNNGTLSPAFSSNSTNYTVTVGSTTNSITLTPTLADANANIHINGTISTPGIPFTTNLNFGNNPIIILVTAQDGATIKTYTINVNRVFSLSATNFNITVTGETCNGSSNGSINIAAGTNLNYTAMLTGNGINTTQKFTTTTSFSNLPIGSYNLTFTVDGQATFSSTYTVTVTQPQPLSVYATVNDAAGNIELALSGGSVYHIQLNNKSYTTTERSFTVPLEAGNNKLQVTTDRECQGIFTKLINPSLNISPYPMPFEGTLNLNLGSANLATVGVRIYSVNTGALVFSGDYQNQSGVLQLNLSNLAKGAYGLQLIINNTKKEFKIIK